MLVELIWPGRAHSPVRTVAEQGLWKWLTVVGVKISV